MTENIDWSEYPDWYADVIERAAVLGCPEAAIINSHIQWQAQEIADLREQVQILEDSARYTGSVKRRYAKLRSMTPEQFAALKEFAQGSYDVFESRLDAMSMPKGIQND